MTVAVSRLSTASGALMRTCFLALSVVSLFTLGCGQTKSVSLSNVTAVRSSDDFVTVQVTLVSNGHLMLEDSDEFCVDARWSRPAVPDGGLSQSDAGAAADAGTMGDAGVTSVPGQLIDSASGCSTRAKGFVIELKSSKAIARPAVLSVSISKGFALGRSDERERLIESP